LFEELETAELLAKGLYNPENVPLGEELLSEDHSRHFDSIGLPLVVPLAFIVNIQLALQILD